MFLQNVPHLVHCRKQEGVLVDVRLITHHLNVHVAEHPKCVRHFSSRKEQVACQQNVSCASSIDDGLAAPLPHVLERADADHCDERTLARDVILAVS